MTQFYSPGESVSLSGFVSSSWTRRIQARVTRPSSNNYLHSAFVKKGKRGACRQKAATVLPNRTAAAKCIYSSLSSFEFDIVGYGAPHDA